MISFRVAANLVAFVLLGVLLSWWALSNHVTFGLTAPDRNVVVMEFAASPGLQPASVVAYQGHAVGEVDRIQLDEDRVRVRTLLDPAEPVPADVTAGVRRASAVGEPYVDLAPRGELAEDYPQLADGDVIPLSRTSVPRSYEEVFRAVADVLDAVPEDALATVVDELATAVEGREDEFATLLADSQDVLHTAAGRADMLDRLATESTHLAGLAADLAPTAGAALDDLGPLASSLADAREDLVTVLETAPGLAERVDTLVADSSQPLGCLLRSLDASLRVLDTPENADRLDTAIGLAPELIEALRTSTHDRDSGPWLRVDAIFNLGASNDPVTTYTDPLPVPGTPALPDACEPVDLGDGAPAPAGDGDVAPTPAAVTPGSPVQGGGTASVSDEADEDASVAAGDVDGARSDGLPWWWVLAALGGLAAAGGAWRLLTGLRRRGDDA